MTAASALVSRFWGAKIRKKLRYWFGIGQVGPFVGPLFLFISSAGISINDGELSLLEQSPLTDKVKGLYT
jgi:hypothetical protein